MKRFFTILLSLGICGCKELLHELEKGALVENPAVTAQVNFCDPDPEINRPLKYTFFIVDTSGSNKDPVDPGNGLPIIPATDPTRALRFDTLQAYLNGQTQDATVYYSLNTFSTDARVAVPSTNNLAGFKAAVLAEKNNGADGGWTSYLRALTLVQTQIDRLAQSFPESSNTQLVISVAFITDGYPAIGFNNQTGQFIYEDETSIINKIRGLMSVQANYRRLIRSIRFHTGYYYQVRDPRARDLLAAMSNVGRGEPNEPLEFPAGQGISFDAFAASDERLRHILRNVTVHNASIVWEPDGEGLPSFELDSDQDGLSDRRERFGGMPLYSDPTKKDSDNNGVSDFVEFTKRGRPCKDARCDSGPASADPFPECDWLRTDTNANGVLDLNEDRDGDGLTACEEHLLGSLDTTHASNGIVLDYLGLIAGVPFIPGTAAEAGKDYDFDGISNLEEVRKNTPVNYPNSRIMGLSIPKYDLQIVGGSLVSTCYKLTVAPIPAIEGAPNHIVVYIQNGFAVANEQENLLTAVKSVHAGSTVIFEQEDFH